MINPLVVVESPTKIRTIKKYLGKNYNVIATVGHIKDLPAKEIGVDIKHNFKPVYITIPGKQNVLKNLKKNAGDATDIYLAPDPDREGEAIAWHTAQVLKKKGRKFHRVLFHELTKKAIKEAILNPKKLDENKYEAQQARRILDRLVGYEISPLLWNKVKRGLSAGRVQSVSVKIICEREKKIFAFESLEYWSITATLKGKESTIFDAKLTLKEGKKITIANEEIANSIFLELSKTQFLVKKITEKINKRNPQPPFITSKLQQEAIRKLGFSAKKTMIIAQQLYEGIDIGPSEPTGLITYMRTDSIRISNEAIMEALTLIHKQFGKDYIPKNPRVFKNKKKVQDAHEAIRPTSVFNTPEKIKPYLTSEQAKLYTMIWQRFIASQMEEALINQKTILINAGKYTFSVSGSSVNFPGFMSLYQSHNDHKNQLITQQLLPTFSLETQLELIKLMPKQHFTQPPPRFSEASLVKELEENGIGRPSTYATILSNIRNKGYVEFQNKHFRPTELGLIVNDLLTESFPEIINVEFTAKMENELDLIEQAGMNYTDVLNNFYSQFSKKLDTAKQGMLSVKGMGIPTSLQCPKCRKEHLRIKIGKNGNFIACGGYPDCTYSSNYKRDNKGNIVLVEPFKAEITNEKCEKCGNFMAVKLGKYGKFLACTSYPKCQNTSSISITEMDSETKIRCPESNCNGKIIKKTSKRGKIFFSCNKFPTCSFASWYKPINEVCPNCNSDYLIEKSTKRKGTVLSCPSRKCDYTKAKE